MQFVVIGAGLAGAATAWGLSRRGHDVTVVERTEPAAADGSSHGSARIFRYAYADRFWVDLVVRSRACYAELEELGGRPLITPTGCLDFGPERDPRLLASALAGAGVAHELLSVDEARDRWPHIAADTDVLWHPDAGVIDAQGAVAAMLDAAAREGARLATHWPVQRVERVGAGFRVIAEDGRTLDAERVVVAAGGWLPALLDRLPLPAAFRAALPPLQVRQENAFHFPYRDPDQAWPTFIHGATGMLTYGLPGGRDAGFRGLKVAEFDGGRVLASAVEQDGRIDPANQARVVEHVRRFVPGVVPEPYAAATCLFTNTPDQEFVVDGGEGITVVSACSGHGAKLAPLVGDIAAGVATGTADAPARFTRGAPGAPRARPSSTSRV